ncbi:MAG: hypothetical protein HOK98_00870 [Rhodospirillaceae bacterium]|nr:hypothetical protein [Rhodospirillaceae bacterium]MBT5943651.1 hypothetical protein [Rhodospirillaceae bacterium]MBT6404828.1 hypothetical protein [Rhodospirillaceae bacterium]MBT6534705.1 hypothetical protein [Rhodospirillaceae bacterium]MBT7363086.1 hypothetical protein [Rhodospirillaceae bacterium]
MNRITSPSSIEIASTHREYDDGNPGTIMTGNTPAFGTQRRAGDWVQTTTETYYDDGEAGTVSG